MGMITVIGSLNMDLVVRTPHIPRAGETLVGSEFHIIPGGKGANQAVAAARSGARTQMVGCVGHDAFGQELLDALTIARVDVSCVESLPNISSGTATILVEDNGQNRIIIVAGANGKVSPEFIQSQWEAIQDSRMILLQQEIPLETINFVLHKAHAEQITTLLNPAPAYKMDPAMLKLVDILILNELEASALTGVAVSTPHAALEAATLLLQLGAGSVIVTLGTQGAVYKDATAAVLEPAYEVESVDTTAAGDTFIGAYAACLLSTHESSTALRFATAAAAISVTRLGAQSSIPRKEEVENFILHHASHHAFSFQPHNLGGEPRI